MTNKQWLIKEMQNMSDEKLDYIIKDCGLCEFVGGYSCNGGCTFDVRKWLKSEHIKLSDAERVILENTDEKRKWIARSELGSLQVFTNRPTKSYRMWNDKEGYDFLGPFNHLFQFITWNDSEPYNIEELLKGEWK